MRDPDRRDLWSVLRGRGTPSLRGLLVRVVVGVALVLGILAVLAVVGLLWNLAVILLLAPRILPASWFERGLVEFGQATGVAASGLLLLRMADPDDRSEALPAFSIKQLLLQPFVAGGVVTVVAPLAVAGWGLAAWSGLCLAVVVVAGAAGLLLARGQSAAAP